MIEAVSDRTRKVLKVDFGCIVVVEKTDGLLYRGVFFLRIKRTALDLNNQLR